jgi:hypothetical protein
MSEINQNFLKKKFNFSQKKIEKLNPYVGQQIIFGDIKTPGLGLRITKNGVNRITLRPNYMASQFD